MSKVMHIMPQIIAVPPQAGYLWRLSASNGGANLWVLGNYTPENPAYTHFAAQWDGSDWVRHDSQFDGYGSAGFGSVDLAATGTDQALVSVAGSGIYRYNGTWASEFTYYPLGSIVRGYLRADDGQITSSFLTKGGDPPYAGTTELRYYLNDGGVPGTWSYHTIDLGTGPSYLIQSSYSVRTPDLTIYVLGQYDTTTRAIWQVTPSAGYVAFNYAAGVAPIQIWAADDSNVFVLQVDTSGGGFFGTYSILQGAGFSWATVATITDTGPYSGGLWQDISGTAANDIWVAGAASDSGTGHYRALIKRWNGSTWTTTALPAVTTSDSYAYAILVLSPTNVWAAGQARDASAGIFRPCTWHWDGATWTQIFV